MFPQCVGSILAIPGFLVVWHGKEILLCPFSGEKSVGSQGSAQAVLSLYIFRIVDKTYVHSTLSNA